MKTKYTSEEEYKYLLQNVNKNSLWDREFIIYQWYVTSQTDQSYECKLKVIFDVVQLSKKIVQVEKWRKSIHFAEKKVTYLTEEDIDLSRLLGQPFISKRRSIQGSCHLDRFIWSNGICEYLLEIENDTRLPTELEKELSLGEEVTHDAAYQNINMAIGFQKEHIHEFQFLIQCISL